MPPTHADVATTARLLPDFTDEIRPPTRRRVLMHNDDRTTMPFVIAVLRTVFSKPADEAERLALTVHEAGRAEIGVYSPEIAEAHVGRTHRLAAAHGFPLRCTLEDE